MDRNLTKLSLSAVVAVALLALGITSILSPASAAKVKTCVDGNISACNQDALDAYLAQQVKIVFISSSLHQGDLGGVAGADAICRGLAAAAGLHGLYRAWIATSSVDDPETRFYKSPAPYIMLDGSLVANDWDDLTDGTIENPIDVDENGASVGLDAIWTNVDIDGTASAPGLDPIKDHCFGWTDNTGPTNGGRVGIDSSSDAGRTQIGGSNSCNSFERVYCFGQ